MPPPATAPGRGIVSTIVKLLIVCLIVGLAFSLFGIDPRNVFSSLGDTAVAIFDLGVRIAQWGIQYVVIGAIVVLPIWLILFTWRKITQSRRR